jgi:hypothetical protein
MMIPSPSVHGFFSQRLCLSYAEFLQYLKDFL